MFNYVFTSDSDEWYTPIDLFNSLDSEFHFTLDPCSFNNNLGLPKFYTKESNGLDKSWANEVCFVNPPYSQIKIWVNKCFNEWKYNNSKIVLLIPCRTDTKYFHDFIYPFCEIRFIKGRLRFSNSRSNAPFPSILCIYK